MIRHANHSARHAQEEAFCRDVDDMLIARLQTQANSDEAKARLAKAAGLKDRKLISQLARLGITPAGLVAVHMTPSLLIAWANQGVDEKERACVMEQARRYGIRERSEAFALVEHWISHRPPVLLFDTWKRFVRHEMASLTSKANARLISLTKEQMVAVAQCTGGFLGFHRVSANEQKLITAMSRILDECFEEAATARRAG